MASGLQFTKSTGEAIANVYEYTQVVELDRVDDPADKHYMVHSYANKQPSLSVHTVLDGVGGNGTNLIEYALDRKSGLRIYLDSNADATDYEQGRSITLAGDDGFRGDLNGRSFVISSTGQTTVGNTTYDYVDVSTSGLAVADEDFNIAASGGPTIFALTSPADDEPTVEAFFEGSHPVYEGAQEDYSSQSIIIREKQVLRQLLKRVLLSLVVGKSRTARKQLLQRPLLWQLILSFLVCKIYTDQWRSLPAQALRVLPL